MNYCFCSTVYMYTRINCVFIILLEDKAIFNYRLSRARRVIENSFGILAARWHIFHRPIIADPTKVVLYIQAAIALHNFLRGTESSYCPPGFTDGEDGSGNIISGSWRNDLVLECIILLILAVTCYYNLCAFYYC